MPQTLSSASMFTPSGFSPHLQSPKESDQGGLIFQDGNLTSASLDALIQHLVPTTEYYPEAKVRKFGPKILQLLTEWAETFPYDFREEKMVAHVKGMIHRIASCDEEQLSHIGPEEFVQAFVHDDPLDSTRPCFSEQKKTTNLEAYVKWFNRLCYLVATEICMHQMDPTGNFYNYRTALRGAAHRSLTAHSNREKKFLELAKQVGEFMTWKQVECPFEQDRSILHYLHNAPIFTEDGEFQTGLTHPPLPAHCPHLHRGR
ncbi:UNVERIFIED_CONTAM: hypothetical protein FKN15_053994 [Acipenser sinensis]